MNERGPMHYSRVGMWVGRPWGGGWLAPDQSAPRAAPSLSAPIDFYYKNFAGGFFLFPAHWKPPDAHSDIGIIRLYGLTNAIDFYNEADVLKGRRTLCSFSRKKLKYPPSVGSLPVVSFILNIGTFSFCLLEMILKRVCKYNVCLYKIPLPLKVWTT